MSETEEVILLLDGDIYAFRASSATDGRQYKVSWKNAEGMIISVFHKYKKEADKVHKEALELYADVTGPDIEFNPEPESYALHLVKKAIESLETELLAQGKRVVGKEVFLSVGKSFRNDIFPDYKMNRDGLRRPTHLNACKDYLRKHYGAKDAPDMYEADDLITMRAQELKDQGKIPVIVSIDKDLKQFPGLYYHIVNSTLLEISQVEADKLFYSQVLMGDTADGIPGIHGIGPKTAHKILEGLTDPFSMYAACLRTYIEETPPNPEVPMDHNEYCQALMHVHCQLLYLLRGKDDQWRIPDAPWERTDQEEAKG